MNESEIMVRYSNDNEGIIMLKDIIDLGVSKQYCLEFLKKNNYKRITRGLYIYTDLWIDYFYVLSYKYSKAVFSMNHQVICWICQIENHYII